MRRKVDLRIPLAMNLNRSCSPKIKCKKVKKNKPGGFKSHSPLASRPYSSQKKMQEVIEFCYNRLEVSLSIIKTVEQKLKTLNLADEL
ncbi:hypothetical protein SteCoe_32296 [Stentor coeruleus]|uniref:Uncharacterized protein n=1 Tax=Stentor coeruleus TaxID=5963 RepID=A0A1R2AZQ7_9CILI|nr:hypothetical protein SteCoe_32296 [Stentor coeruleus]